MGTLSIAELQGPVAVGVGEESKNSPPDCHGVRTEPPYIISVLTFECSPQHEHFLLEILLSF